MAGYTAEINDIALLPKPPQPLSYVHVYHTLSIKMFINIHKGKLYQTVEQSKENSQHLALDITL